MADEEQTQHLTVVMTEISTKMQVLLDKQDELAENISKIKEAVYHPDKGLYARLNKLDSRLDMLEAWKDNNAKVMWMVITMVTGLVITTGWKALF